MNKEFENHEPKPRPKDGVEEDVEPNTVVRYWIHDISADIQRHLVCVLKLPNKHKKLLAKENKDVLKIDIHYRDTKLIGHTYDKVIQYQELPTGSPRVP